VDIRKDSQTFGKHIAVELNSREQIALWVPQGFAHGFQALEDGTKVLYKVTNYWAKESENSLRFDDPLVNISWFNIKQILSDKDLDAPYLRNI
jgi:dTDP-4-dehydrorhamnose 3,5-epimerase